MKILTSMNGKILEYYKKFKIAYLNFKYRKEISPKTGISNSERKRLLNYPKFEIGKAHFFQKPFYFSHGPSFIHSLDEIFLEDIYKFVSDIDNPYIIDCGANIGLSIYYFKKMFPKSEIIAFEPDEKIFELLEKNLENFPNKENIKIEKKAVWTEKTQLEFFSEGALAGSLVTDYAKKNKLFTIEAINLKNYLDKPVDFLKIDIEGAENKVIFDLDGKLEYVKNLFLEYHGIIGEEQNLGEILCLLKKYGFQFYIRSATEKLKYPFCKEHPKFFNMQLNIFCYRK